MGVAARLKASESGHFVETTTALIVPNGTVVGGCGLESAVRSVRFSCGCDRLGANKSELVAKHGLSPQVWTGMTGNL